MASVNRPTSVEQCIADITECSICNEVLQDNRCLPCLHTFCLKCLETYKKGKSKEKTIPCPVCRRAIPTPKYVANLPRNFFIDKLIDAHRRKQQAVPKICEICESTKVVEATHFCCDCHQYLCLSCEGQHKKIKATMMHRTVDSTGVTDPQELAPRPTYCIVHTTKEAEVYCQECNMVICWRCKHVTHSSHTSIEISCAAKDLAEKLEKHVELLSEHVRNKQYDIIKLTEREKFYTDEIDAESANICRELNRLYRNITDNGDKLKKALTTSTTVHLNAIQSFRDKLETDVNELKRHKVYIEQLIHLGNVSDLCEYTDKLISETVRMAAKNTCEIIVPSVTHLAAVDLQDLLIGNRTDIDQQYMRNNSKEQLQDDVHPNNYSKEENSQERGNEMVSAKPKQSNVVGNPEDTEKKRKKPSSKKMKGILRSMSLPKSSSRDSFSKVQSKAKDLSEDKIEEEELDSEDTETLKRVAAASDKSGRVVQNPSNLLDITQLTAFKNLQIHVQSQGERYPKYKSGSLVRTISLKDDGAICGITVLDSKLYTVLQNNSNIQVYDSAEFVFLKEFKIDGLVNPNDITPCKFNNCLYICDWGSTRIFRVGIGEGLKQMNWSTDGDIGGVSVTAEHKVLLAGYMSNKLKEYTCKGELIRSVSLDDGFKPWYAISLISSDFLICQGDNSKSGHHRVCLTDSNGKLKKSFGGIMGSGVAHLNGPYQLTVDKNGCILVNDCNNRRILLLSQDLKFIMEIVPTSSDLLRRARRMYLDEAVGRLYVADNVTTGGETKDGRIQVFSI